MISHELKLILIHINKNGGTSLAAALNQFRDRKFKSHWPLWKIQAELLVQGYDPDEYTSVTVIRHPLDRFVSSYEYRRQMCKPGTPSIIGKNITYEQFLTEVMPGERKNRTLNPQQWFMNKEQQGTTVDVDFILRFEEGLQEQWNALVKRRVSRLPLIVDFPHRNRTDRRPWQEYYSSPKMIDAVYQRAHSDTQFGYRFDLTDPYDALGVDPYLKSKMIVS